MPVYAGKVEILTQEKAQELASQDKKIRSETKNIKIREEDKPVRIDKKIRSEDKIPTQINNIDTKIKKPSIKVSVQDEPSKPNLLKPSRYVLDLMS